MLKKTVTTLAAAAFTLGGLTVAAAGPAEAGVVVACNNSSEAKQIADWQRYTSPVCNPIGPSATQVYNEQASVGYITIKSDGGQYTLNVHPDGWAAGASVYANGWVPRYVYLTPTFCLSYKYRDSNGVESASTVISSGGQYAYHDIGRFNYQLKTLLYHC